MLKVYISKHFYEEKKYIVEVFFDYLVKVDYEIKTHENDNYIVELPNGNVIEIIDYFFRDKKENDYLTTASIPDEIGLVNNEFVVDKDMPILFGKDLIENNEVENKRRTIIHADIFSSAFFILSRMEEYIINERDNRGRFSSQNSIAHKYNFLHRPVVNEYAEMLWNILISLGFDEEAREFGKYELIPTHDVDEMYYKFKLENFIADIVLDKSLDRAWKRIKLGNKNCWDTFSWLMDVSERNNVKSIFYFMTGSNSAMDNDYVPGDKFVREKISEIKQRGHLFGFHPGYETMEKPEEFMRQKSVLENSVGQEIDTIRHHYLRFSIPQTYSIWEANGVRYDSSISYSDQVGFRCGTSSEYPLFHVTERRKLDIIEQPLVIMDVLIHDRKDPEGSAKDSVKIISSYKEICKRYRIPLCILFHNSNFDPIRWKGWKEAYESYFD